MPPGETDETDERRIRQGIAQVAGEVVEHLAGLFVRLAAEPILAAVHLIRDDDNVLLRISFDELWKAVDEATANGGGTKTLNLSPHGAILSALLLSQVDFCQAIRVGFGGS